MGMFDTITVKRSFLFYLRRYNLATLKTIEAFDLTDSYQTKDLECMMEIYELRQCWLHHLIREWDVVPEEERPFGKDESPIMRFCGMLRARDMGWKKIKQTMTIHMYTMDTEFEVELFRGRVTRVRLLEEEGKLWQLRRLDIRNIQNRRMYL